MGSIEIRAMRGGSACIVILSNTDRGGKGSSVGPEGHENMKATKSTKNGWKLGKYM
jgi:hypothetical protein